MSKVMMAVVAVLVVIALVLFVKWLRSDKEQLPGGAQPTVSVKASASEEPVFGGNEK